MDTLQWAAIFPIQFSLGCMSKQAEQARNREGGEREVEGDRDRELASNISLWLIVVIFYLYLNK